MALAALFCSNNNYSSQFFASWTLMETIFGTQRTRREKEESAAATLRNVPLTELWVKCTSLHLRGSTLHTDKTRGSGSSGPSARVFTLPVTVQRPTSGASTWWHFPLTVTALFYLTETADVTTTIRLTSIWPNKWGGEAGKNKEADERLQKMSEACGTELRFFMLALGCAVASSTEGGTQRLKGR